ncbi:MAG: glycosyltransferase family 2 protein [Deltaproteobacteria bacterium]|nr:glycosyltransferase family 2 protein [Deltaproteobacteria bacterium]
MKITCVIAAHNEEGNLAPVIAGVKQHTQGLTEVLVVDDGSTDGTAAEAEAAGARVVRQTPNRGKGAALLRGLRELDGSPDYVLFIDGDGQDDPADIPALVEAARGGGEFVNGSRWLGTLKRGSISFPNRLGNRFMTELLNVRHGARITDSQAGFRLIHTRLLDPDRFRSREYEVETEMVLHAVRSGARIAEVPVTRHPRGEGDTDFKRVRNGLRILATILVGRPVFR